MKTIVTTASTTGAPLLALFIRAENPVEGLQAVTSLGTSQRNCILEWIAARECKDLENRWYLLAAGSVLVSFVKANPSRALHPWRQAAGNCVAALESLHATEVAVDVAACSEQQTGALCDGLLLAGYEFARISAETPKEKVITFHFLPLNAAQEAAFNHSQILCAGSNTARRLADMPANLMTPSLLADQALQIAKANGLDCKILDKNAIVKEGMGALLAVSQGSVHEPRLIVMEYRHPLARQTLCLVGKGLTFDAGGVNVKLGRGLGEMKYDKSGGSAVIATMQVIAQLQPHMNVIAIVPATENTIGPDAFKPGDVIQACNGKTIEVANTDAEGRLILCDALAYGVKHYQPDLMLSIATLTGAVISALGRGVSAITGTSDALCRAVIAAGEVVDERLWQIPLFDVHDELLKSNFADLLNVEESGEGSLINGPAFLKHFVGDTPWAAIDIGGTAWRHSGASYIRGKGASGVGVRFFTEYILTATKNSKI